MWAASLDGGGQTVAGAEVKVFQRKRSSSYRL